MEKVSGNGEMRGLKGVGEMCGDELGDLMGKEMGVEEVRVGKREGVKEVVEL